MLNVRNVRCCYSPAPQFKTQHSPFNICLGAFALSRMLKKARLLTRPTLARRDALYPERGPSSFLYLPLEEWPRLPSTARIERAQFHRARSASKEGTWPLLPHPSEAERCASKGIVSATPSHFFSFLLSQKATPPAYSREQVPQRDTRDDAPSTSPAGASRRTRRSSMQSA
jgi:hypothetical protein